MSSLFSSMQNAFLDMGGFLPITSLQNGRRSSALSSAANLDLTYITPKLICMGIPASSKTSSKSHRNNIGEVSKYLSDKHHRSYLVVNLSKEERIDYFHFDHQAIEVDLAGKPSLETILRLCYAIHYFLLQDEGNVVAIHCKDGITTTRILVSCYLTYCGNYDNTHESLNGFCQQRSNSKIISYRFLKSHQRYLLDRFQFLLEHGSVLEPDPLQLSTVIIDALPYHSVSGAETCLPVIHIYSGRHHKESFNSIDSQDSILWSQEKGQMTIKCDVPLFGDCMLVCRYRNEDGTTVTEVFSYYFHVGFMGVGCFTVNQGHIDTRYPSMFKGTEEEFKMHLSLIQLPEAQSSMYLEKNEGLCVVDGKQAISLGLETLVANHQILPDEEKLAKLLEMGFGKMEGIFALQRSNNNISLATSMCGDVSVPFPEARRRAKEGSESIEDEANTLDFLVGNSKSFLQQQSVDIPSMVQDGVRGLVNFITDPGLVEDADFAGLFPETSRALFYEGAEYEDEACSSHCSSDTSKSSFIPRDIENMLQSMKHECDDFMLGVSATRERMSLDRDEYIRNLEEEMSDGNSSDGSCGSDAVFRTPTKGGKRNTRSTKTSNSRELSPFLKETFGHGLSSPTIMTPRKRYYPSGALPFISEDQMTEDLLAMLNQLSEQEVTSSPRKEKFVKAHQGNTADHKPIVERNLALVGELVAGNAVIVSKSEWDIKSNEKDEEQKNTSLGDQQTQPPGNSINVSEHCSLENRYESEKLAQSVNADATSLRTSEFPPATKLKDESIQQQGKVPTNEVARLESVEVQAVHIPQPGTGEESVQSKEDSFTLSNREALPDIQRKSEEHSSDRRSGNSSGEVVSSFSHEEPAKDPKAALLTAIRSKGKATTPAVPVQNNESSESATTPDGAEGQSRRNSDAAPASDNTQEESKASNVTSSATSVCQKYLKMLKFGVPQGAVEEKMMKDGVDPKLLGLALGDGSQVTPNVVDVSEKVVSPAKEMEGIVAKNHPVLCRYFKMLKMGVPPPAVMQKMVQESIDPVHLQNGPDAIVPENLNNEPNTLKAGEHPVLSKYFKMLKMGVPEPAVMLKMQQEEIDPSYLKGGPDVIVPADLANAVTQTKEVLLKDHPMYGKFFRMLKMGVPHPAVVLKMSQEGLDPGLLESDPEVTFVPLSPEKKAKPVTVKKPKVRRKKIHWEPIPESRLKGARESVWSVGAVGGILKHRLDKLRYVDKEGESTVDENTTIDLTIDEDELESLFVEKPKKIESSGIKSKADVNNANEPKKEKKVVSLLDGRRAQNIGIGLAKVKLPHEAVADAFLRYDYKALGEECVKVLQQAQMLPTAEEVKLVMNYKGNIDCLGEPEKFALSMSRIPKCHQRLEILSYIFSFEEHRLDLKKPIDTLTSVCQKVRQSEELKQLLQVVLLIGNKINSESRGHIMGFTVASLLKLSQTKSFNRKTTILDYIVGFISKQIPVVLDFASGLGALQEAARISIEGIKASESAVHRGLQDLFRAIREGSEVEKHALQKFALKAQSQLEEVHKQVTEMEDAYSELLQYFGEDPDLPSNEFFETLQTFCTAFQLSRVAYERQAKRQARKSNHQTRESSKENPRALASSSVEMSKIAVKAEGCVPVMESTVSVVEARLLVNSEQVEVEYSIADTTQGEETESKELAVQKKKDAAEAKFTARMKEAEKRHVERTQAASAAQLYRKVEMKETPHLKSLLAEIKETAAS